MIPTPYNHEEDTLWRSTVIDSLERVEKLVTKTNGRVTKLENWRWMTVGAIAIIVTVVLPLVVYINTMEVQSVQAQINHVK